MEFKTRKGFWRGDSGPLNLKLSSHLYALLLQTSKVSSYAYNVKDITLMCIDMIRMKYTKLNVLLVDTNEQVQHFMLVNELLVSSQKTHLVE